MIARPKDLNVFLPVSVVHAQPMDSTTHSAAIPTQIPR